MKILSSLLVSLLLFVGVAFPALAGIEPSPFNVAVPANVQWFNSGLTLASGQSFNITASGSWMTDSMTYGADGMVIVGTGGYLLPTAPAYSLIGKMGSGAPFFIGSSYHETADVSGTLFLSMNDVPSEFGNNSGSLSVTILASVQPSPSVPGVSFWGNAALALLIGGAIFWKMRGKLSLRTS